MRFTKPCWAGNETMNLLFATGSNTRYDAIRAVRLDKSSANIFDVVFQKALSVATIDTFSVRSVNFLFS